MFQLETANIRFKHRAHCSKGYWGQRSPKVIQGHLFTLNVKNKIIAIPHRLLYIAKPETCYISVTGQILCSCLLLFTFGAVCVPDTVVWHQWI